ncbi:hypothetical protein ACFXJ8_29360 [Nonomuraea sp. NPDC059194]|uniref:hypothetical protein n=1 Tax=Nonomuraea sp. NPDC059194 TaxID=3346764 RepID=UPI00367DDB83
MQNIVNSLAVLAFLASVLSLFALSAMLKMIRDLQNAALRAPAAVRHDTPRVVERFASADGRPTYVLVVSSGCGSCEERALHLARVAHAVPDGRLVLLAASLDCAEWVAGAPVEALIDAELLGRVAVGATPTLLRYTAAGVEEWRRLAGSDDDLDNLLRVNAASAADQKGTR